MRKSSGTTISVSAKILKGFCKCGCGRLTRLAYQNHTKNGWRKGSPLRFIAGHQRRMPAMPTFLSRIQKTSECWNWTGGCFVDGYGRFVHNHKVYKAHRFSYEIYFGAIPDGFMVCHRCDNKPCVRPSHLFLGVAKDNSVDAMLKDRVAYGESHGRAKLTADDARSIVREYRDGRASQNALSRRFGVAPNAIWCIVHGLHWRRATEAIR